MNEILKGIFDQLEEKQAEDIMILDVQKITSIADYFVIASADNERKVKAIADAVEEYVEKNDMMIRAKEGMSTAKWILMDFGSIIIHIFKNDERDFYNIEKIWKDGINITPN